jgi:ABC-type uncharacterized transport system permease subunit
MEETEYQRTHRLTRQAQSKERSNYLWLFGTIGFVLILAVMCEDDNAGSSVETYTPEDMDAYIMAKQLLEMRLKAPSTAEFASFP